MKFPTKIVSRSLILRKIVSDDANAIFNGFAQDKSVTKYLTWAPHKNLSETKKFVRHCIREWQKEISFAYAICEKESESLIGIIHPRPDSFKIDLGFVLAKKFWSKGYMTEALSQMLKILKKQKGIYRISAFCDIDNVGSARVMEKCGMQYEGIFRRFFIRPTISKTKPNDVKVFSICK